MKQIHAIAMRSRLVPIALFIAVLSISTSVRGQDTTSHSIVRSLSEIKFITVPGLPTCAPAFVQSGDPTKGPSIITGKLKAGCIIPWHWHTPNEHLMIVSGVASVQMKGEKPVTLKAGDFAMMPSRHIHQFRCIEDCVLYVYSDAAFDIHYVDEQGKEISPDDALRAVNETAAKEPK